jgi:hypothetical protein
MAITTGGSAKSRLPLSKITDGFHFFDRPVPLGPNGKPKLTDLSQRQVDMSHLENRLVVLTARFEMRCNVSW